VFLRQLFPDGLQGDFQLISRLRLWLEFMVLFQHSARQYSPAGSDLESFGPFVLLNELVHLQPVLHDARTLRNGVVLVETT